MSNASSKPTKTASADTVVAETQKERPGIPWRPLTAVLIVVLGFIAAQVLGGIIISLYPPLRHWNSAQAGDWIDNSISAQFVYVLISEIVLVGVIYWFVRWRKGSLQALGLRRPRWRDAGYALAGALAYIVLYFAAIVVVELLVRLNLSQQQDIGFQNPVGAPALVLTFISLAVLPPLAEEFAFRGFLFTTLKQRYGLYIGALGTSALFAVPHLLESSGGGLLWVAGLDTFVLSLVLCYLRNKTGRLWAGVAVHVMKNSIAFLSLFIIHTR